MISVIVLMVWFVLSKIIDINSKVYFDYNYGEVSELDLNDLFKYLCKYFFLVKVLLLLCNDLLVLECIIVCFVIVNFFILC